MRRRAITANVRRWAGRKFGQRRRLNVTPKISAMQIAHMCRPRTPQTPPPQDNYERRLNDLMTLQHTPRARTANASGQRNRRRMSYNSDFESKQVGDVSLITRKDFGYAKGPNIHEISPSVKRRNQSVPDRKKCKDKLPHSIPESRYLSTKYSFHESKASYEVMLSKIGIANHLRKKIVAQKTGPDYAETKYMSESGI